MARRALKVLRRTVIVVAAALLVLVLLIQFQQRLLVHRAERLHAEVLALQLHPGTFADIQLLQREWGYTAKYDGECTAHHCNYMIGLGTMLESLCERTSWCPSPHHLELFDRIGLRAASVFAEIRVRDDRMWAADFWVVTDMTIRIQYGPRLFTDAHYSPGALKRGYLIGRPDACTGCVAAWVHLTPRASPDDIRRLNQIYLTCLTRRQRCSSPADVIPAAWEEYVRTPESAASAFWDCSPSLEQLAIEAPHIALVTVVPALTAELGLVDSATAKVRIESILKGTGGPTVGSRALVGKESEELHLLTPQMKSLFLRSAVGQPFLLLYSEAGLSFSRFLDVQGCGIFPATAENRRAVQKAISDDPSVGEPYVQEIVFP